MGELSRPKDTIIPFYLDNGSVKGKLVRLGEQVDLLLKRHAYPAIVNRHLTELIAFGAALSADMKEAGALTLQITGGKIVRLLVVEINHLGHVRACAKWDDDLLGHVLEENKNGGGLSVPQLFEGGCMVITMQLDGLDDKHQALVELSGKTLADCIHHYFRQSEQIQTSLVLTSRSEISFDYMGGIVLLQKMPPLPGSVQTDQEVDDWITDLSLLGTLTDKELLDHSLSHGDLLFRLFHERGVRVFDEKKLMFQCSCSKERIETMLNQFGNDDINHMTENGVIAVTCEFCNENYTFDPQKYIKTPS